jgi:hypothetical protein
MRWWRIVRLRRRLRSPSPSLQLVLNRLRTYLETAPGAALALVEVGSADASALTAVALGCSLAREGQRVVLADAARGRPLAGLLGGRGVGGTVRTVSVKGLELGLFVAPADPTEMAEKEAGEDADAILVVATVDAAVGADHIAAWASDAVVMVQAGGANGAHIDGVARQLRDARMIIRSGLLINTDPGDHTSGVPASYRQTGDAADFLMESIKATGQ